MGVYGALFCVGGVEWGWAGHYFGWVGVVRSEWGWMHCLIMPEMFTFMTNGINNLFDIVADLVGRYATFINLRTPYITQTS